LRVHVARGTDGMRSSMRAGTCFVVFGKSQTAGTVHMGRRYPLSNPGDACPASVSRVSQYAYTKENVSTAKYVGSEDILYFCYQPSRR
jgi:hypothetical protein